MPGVSGTTNTDGVKKHHHHHHKKKNNDGDPTGGQGLSANNNLSGQPTDTTQIPSSVTPQ